MSDKNKKPKAALLPILDADVPQAAKFLHEQMNQRFSPLVWEKCLRSSWVENAPNHGFMLQDEQQSVVGIICALYSRQTFNGEVLQVCNPHSWVVLPEFRGQSVSLVLAAIKQSGYHFTMFTPNQDGLEIFAFLRFKPLEKSTVRTINFPTRIIGGKVSLEVDRSKMLSLLEGDEKQKLADHIGFEWIVPVVYQTPTGNGFVLLKMHKFKRLKAAQILYQSNSKQVLTYWTSIRTQLLTKLGVFTTKFEKRLLSNDLPFWHKEEEDHQRFYLSDKLQPHEVQYLYSEMVALDL